MKKVYILENLGCANCAAKIEKKIASLEGVEEATVTFATKQLRLVADDPDALLPEIEKIAHSLEPDIRILERETRQRAAEPPSHDHKHCCEQGDSHDSCGCGEEHTHDHSNCDGEHQHDHNNCCGQEISQDNGCGCGCEDDHSHNHSNCNGEHQHDHNNCCGHDISQDNGCGCGYEDDHSHNHNDCNDEHQHDHNNCCDQDVSHVKGCDCGEEHSHAHDTCGCGEDHPHLENHPPGCDCAQCRHNAGYCAICGESFERCTCAMPDEQARKMVFVLEHLGCANCAAKMEAKIRNLPGVQYASITFATKQLRISAEDTDQLLENIQNICSSIESEVRVIPQPVSPGQRRRGLAQATGEGDRSEASKGIATPPASAPGEKTKLSPPLTAKGNPSPTAKGQAKSRPGLSQETKSLIQIGVGALLLIAGVLLERAGFQYYPLPLFLAAYLVLGTKVVLTAAKNLVRGRVFDENFLMAIATLGAFAIQEYPEAVGVLLFYKIGEWFEHKAVEKNRSQIMEAVDLRPETVNLMIGDEVQVIDAGDANVGDILLVRPGDRIPLDGIVIDGESRIDTSPVTGESLPRRATYGDEVISGCVNTSGALKIRVEKVLEESMVTRILDSVENAAASKPKIDRFITKFAAVYTPIVVAAALLTAIIPSLITGDWNHWVYTALTFLVISCPCALVLSVPLAFFSGIGAGSKRGILFKGGVALEALKGVKAVIMDKTGTITEGNFVVQRILPAQGMEELELLSMAAGCERNSTHPIANSIVSAAKERNLEILSPDQVEERPGLGVKAFLGSRTVLCGNRKFLESLRIDLPAQKGEHTGTEVFLAVNDVYAGCILIADTVKPGAVSAVADMKKMGLKTAMLTGDATQTAEAVAQAVGIDEVHARLLPQDKLNALTRLRDKYESVMFVGDGINDAPVLAGANVGAAMGSGADAAIEAADVVFMTSGMEAIPESIRIARAATRISAQNIVFSLATKILVMVLGLLGFASMWMAVFADTGVAMLCVLNAMRILYRK